MDAPSTIVCSCLHNCGMKLATSVCALCTWLSNYVGVNSYRLIVGLKDLADFLPASMATIVSYLSAETTRGLWKPASMNGTDWPSPAASLAMVEKNINKILAATGVEVPSLSAGIWLVKNFLSVFK